MAMLSNDQGNDSSILAEITVWKIELSFVSYFCLEIGFEMKTLLNFTQISAIQLKHVNTKLFVTVSS